MEENLQPPADTAEEISNAADTDGTPDLRNEVERLKLELLCAEMGVRKECRNDVIRLSEGGSIQDVIKKYPVFLERSPRPDTGVFSENGSDGCSDDSLRRAFGLKK